MDRGDPSVPPWRIDNDIRVLDERRVGRFGKQSRLLANAKHSDGELKFREYDFHFRFGTAAHGGAQGLPLYRK